MINQLTISRYLLLSLTLLLGMITMAGCSKNQPSDSQIQTMAADYFNNEYKGLFKVEKVVKQNGYKQRDNHYVAELTLSATAQSSLAEYADKLMSDTNLDAMDKFTKGMQVTMLKISMPEFNSGDTLEFHKDYLFINTDNGWRIQKEINSENNQFNNQ